LIELLLLAGPTITSIPHITPHRSSSLSHKVRFRYQTGRRGVRYRLFGINILLSGEDSGTGVLDDFATPLGLVDGDLALGCDVVEALGRDVVEALGRDVVEALGRDVVEALGRVEACVLRRRSRGRVDGGPAELHGSVVRVLPSCLILQYLPRQPRTLIFVYDFRIENWCAVQDLLDDGGRRIKNK